MTAPGSEIPSVVRLMRRTVSLWLGLGLGAAAAIMLAVAVALPSSGGPTSEFDRNPTPGFGEETGGDDAWIRWLLGAIGLAEGAGALALLRWTRSEAAAMHRIGRDGVRIAGEVTEIRPTSIRVNNQTQFRLHWRYLDEGGRERTGRSWLGPSRRFRGLAPGEAVEIAVDPRDTGRSVWLGDLRV